MTTIVVESWQISSRDESRRHVAQEKGGQVMGDKSAVMSVRQASEFDFALERNGYTADDVKRLSTGDMLAKIRPIVRGHAEIVLIEYLICGENVSKLEKKDGELYFNGRRLTLFLSESQKNEGARGYELRKELQACCDIVPAEILDCLNRCPELWPESWKKDANGNTIKVHFWNDISGLKGLEGVHFVESGCWFDNYGGSVSPIGSSLHMNFGVDCPAAVFA